MPPLSTRSVLITGTSSGIGEAAALYLAGRGHRVFATSRSLERLRTLEQRAESASLPISIFELDVNEPESVALQVPAILEQAGTLDALVNNAGYGLRGCLEDLEIEEVRAQFETNLFAVLRMSQAVLPHMRARKQGTIINVGSVSANIGSPAGGAYASSKAALRSLNAVLRIEVHRFGVRVAIIEPGLFRSNFQHNQVVGRRVAAADSPYRSYEERVTRRISRFHRRGGDPVRVAKLIERIMLSRRVRPRYSVGIEAGLGVMAARLLPDGVLEFFLKRILSG